MADISAKDVAALRKITGAGMMDCKKALLENDGDFERAKDWLREKGIAGAAKREGRAADQGAIEVLVQGGERQRPRQFDRRQAEARDAAAAKQREIEERARAAKEAKKPAADTPEAPASGEGSETNTDEG